MVERIAAMLLICLTCTTGAQSQDWKRVHSNDEAKWARRTGLSAGAVHELWRKASHFADENDDDSRIELLAALPEKNHFLLVTSPQGEDCVAVSVFLVAPPLNRKLWAVEQTPGGKGFCATQFGRAEVEVLEGNIRLLVPETQNPDNSVTVVVYEYGLKDGKYMFIGTKRLNRLGTTPSAKTE